MSAECVAWVMKYSPYKGTKYAIHLVIADVVNAPNGFKFWMRQEKIAAAARTTRPTVSSFIQEMIRDGLTECVQDNSKNGHNNPSVFRFLMPTEARVVYDSTTKSGHPDDTEPEVDMPAGHFRKSEETRQREAMLAQDAPTLFDDGDSAPDDDDVIDVNPDAPMGTVVPMHPPADSLSDADQPRTAAQARAELPQFPLDGDDKKACKEAAGQVLAHYTLWRKESGLGRLSIGSWHGEIRKMAEHLIAKEGLAPAVVSTIVLEWHDKGMERERKGGKMYAPGAIKTFAQAFVDRANGAQVHGRDGDGVSARQHDTNQRLSALADPSVLENLI